MNWLSAKNILWISMGTSIYFLVLHPSRPLLTENTVKVLEVPVLILQLLVILIANYKLSIEKLGNQKLFLIVSIVLLSISIYFNLGKYFS